MRVRKLYRSEDEKLIAGTCGGVGEYFAIDPVLVRVGTLVCTFLTGIIPGIILYGILIFIIPSRSGGHMYAEVAGDTAQENGYNETKANE